MDTTTGMQRLRSVAREIGGLRLLLLYGCRKPPRLQPRRRGVHEQFVLTAVRYWCDIEPVVRRTHEQLLADLG